MDKEDAAEQTSEKRKSGGSRSLKKINDRISELRKVFHNSKTIRLMFQDEAGFGRINKLPNIEIMYIPPYTPEMNPIEQIWKEIRARGFHNEVFQTLDKVVDRLCDTIRNLTADTIRFHSI